MLKPEQKLAIFMQDSVQDKYGKMGQGILRYSPNPVVCVIDNGPCVGQDMLAFYPQGRSCPIVATIDDALNLGAEALVLGISPSGGRLPSGWVAVLDEAVAKGLSIVNGLHERLAERYTDLHPGQWIWDVRREPDGLGVGMGRAAALNNLRVLTVGLDMSVGKKTTALELYRAALVRDIKASFVATGQGGVTIMGRGIPLDAVRVDFAAGAVEREVLAVGDSELIVVEGQGSLAHPGSTATLPLMRGAQPTHLIMCMRLGQTHLASAPHIPVPDIARCIRLCEDVAEGCGSFARPKTIGVSVNPGNVTDRNKVASALKAVEDRLGLPCLDPVAHDVSPFLDALTAG